MHYDPTPDEVMSATAVFLRDDVMPVLKGKLVSRALVAANALESALRTLRLDAGMKPRYPLHRGRAPDAPADTFADELVCRAVGNDNGGLVTCPLGGFWPEKTQRNAAPLRANGPYWLSR